MRISNIKLSYTRAREIIREDLSSTNFLTPVQAVSVAIRSAFLDKNIYVFFMKSNIIRFDITQLIIP
jgi:hypothetical protein